MKAFFAFALVAAVAAMTAPAAATEYQWCAVYNSAEGGMSCAFDTYQQCMEDLSGKGGSCQRNFDYGRRR